MRKSSATKDSSSPKKATVATKRVRKPNTAKKISITPSKGLEKDLNLPEGSLSRPILTLKQIYILLRDSTWETFVNNLIPQGRSYEEGRTIIKLIEVSLDSNNAVKLLDMNYVHLAGYTYAENLQADYDFVRETLETFLWKGRVSLDLEFSLKFSNAFIQLSSFLTVTPERVMKGLLTCD